MKKDKKYFLYFCIIVSLALLCITIYRAATTSITYDEAYTYLNYVKRNPFEVFIHFFDKGTLANNHIINTFLISLFTTLFNIQFSEFIIRLPNILFYTVYLFFGYRICKDYKYKYSAFSLLAFNYGVNEFFGLARGYGMSSALVLVGLFYFKEYLKNDSKSSLNTSYIFLLLSCYANSSSLIIFATIILLSVFRLIKNKKLIDYMKYNYLLIPIVVSTLLIIFYHFLVSREGLPLFGGDMGFYSDVLVQIVYVYGFPIKYINALLNLTIFILTIIVSRNYNKKNSYYLILTGPLYFTLLYVITKLFGQLWLTGRLLLPAMPLLIINVIEILELLKTKKSTLIQIVVIVILIITFASNYNIKYTREWVENYPIKEKCYNVIEKNNNEEVINLGYSPVADFYREKILLENNYDIYNVDNGVE